MRKQIDLIKIPTKDILKMLNTSLHDDLRELNRLDEKLKEIKDQIFFKKEDIKTCHELIEMFRES